MTVYYDQRKYYDVISRVQHLNKGTTKLYKSGERYQMDIETQRLKINWQKTWKRLTDKQTDNSTNDTTYTTKD